MRINVGFEMIYDCPQPTPMIFNLNVHYTRVSDLVGRDDLLFDPPVPVDAYRDGFGNWCTRIVALKGRTRVTANAVVNDTDFQTPSFPMQARFPSKSYRSRLWCICWAAVTAKPTDSQRRHGTFSSTSRPDGPVFRRSATTSTTM